MSQANKETVVQDQAEQPTLVDKGGVLVVKGELLDDLTDVVRRERDCRVADLVRQIKSDWDVLTRLIESCTVETGIPDLAHQHDHYLCGKPKTA